ncbi:MAG: transketolase [Candidatus Gastranaerophilales bacterium]
MLTIEEKNELKSFSKQSRLNILKMIYNAQSGHIGGAFSSVELLTVLYHKFMNVNPNNLNDENRDRFVLSKGHASSLLYSILSQLGFLPEQELMTFRLLDTRLQGHPALFCPGIDVATGSLGQGLSIACGMALGLKLDKKEACVYALLGDGELQEGSAWEGFMNAGHRKLSNLVAIIDRNKLQIDGCTEDLKSLDNLADKIKAFNWEVLEIDGHNLDEIHSAIKLAKSNSKPTAIIANTVKGKGVSFMENNAGWHGKAPNTADFEKALSELETSL